GRRNRAHPQGATGRDRSPPPARSILAPVPPLGIHSLQRIPPRIRDGVKGEVLTMTSRLPLIVLCLLLLTLGCENDRTIPPAPTARVVPGPTATGQEGAISERGAPAALPGATPGDSRPAQA